MNQSATAKADFDLPSGDIRAAWAYRPTHAPEVRCAWLQGREDWNGQGPEAQCPYPEGHPLKKAWGMGYNDARKQTSRDEQAVIRHFRARGEVH